MTKWRTAVLVAALLTGCSRPHQEPGPVPVPAPTPTPAPSRPPIGEHLLAEPPADWVQSFHTDTPGMRMVEYVPQGDDPADWTDKVSFESFTGNPLPKPDELLTSIADDQRKGCDNFESHATYSGDENGYPTAVRLFVCDRSKLTQKGQLTLLKTIRGDAEFYVIMRARRVAPIAKDDAWPIPKELMAEWSLYLHAIGLCNGDDPAHPCPSVPEKGSDTTLPGAEVGDVSDPNAASSKPSPRVP
jgi:hypothetical protein